MRAQFSILDDHEVVPVPDARTWGRWFERAERTVKITLVAGEARVSTVFLGIDHNQFGAEPHVFETMVFGGRLNGETSRYSTWEKAAAGHVAMVQRVRQQEYL